MRSWKRRGDVQRHIVIFGLVFSHQILGLPADRPPVLLDLRRLHVVHLEDVDQLVAERANVLANLSIQ